MSFKLCRASLVSLMQSAPLASFSISLRFVIVVEILSQPISEIIATMIFRSTRKRQIRCDEEVCPTRRTPVTARDRISRTREGRMCFDDPARDPLTIEPASQITRSGGGHIEALTFREHHPAGRITVT